MIGFHQLESFLLILLFGLVMAVILGVFLIGLFRLIGRLRTIPGFRRVAPAIDRELSAEMRLAIIGGVVGGVAFAAIGPAITPVIYDTQVELGVVDEPAPEIGIDPVGSPSPAQMESLAGNDSEEYALFLVNISQIDRRAISAYSLNIRFDGCVEQTNILATNIGASVLRSNTDRVQAVGTNENDSTSTCYGGVYIDQFNPGDRVLLTFAVNTSRTPSTGNLYPDPTVPETALVTDSYSWEYNGYTYYNRPKLQIHPWGEVIANER